MQQTARIAATVTQALALNVPLATAIATGHDLGHACFGHGGEAALQQVAPAASTTPARGAAAHPARAPQPHRRGAGGDRPPLLEARAPSTLEGLRRLADRIALPHRRPHRRPPGRSPWRRRPGPGRGPPGLGEQPADMIGVLVEDVIRHSAAPTGRPGGRRLRRGHVGDALVHVRARHRPEAERKTERATRLLTDLYGHYLRHPDAMPMGASLATDPVAQQAVDAIAGMTDRYALAAWKAAALAPRPSGRVLRRVARGILRPRSGDLSRARTRPWTGSRGTSGGRRCAPPTPTASSSWRPAPAPRRPAAPAQPPEPKRAAAKANLVRSAVWYGMISVVLIVVWARAAATTRPAATAEPSKSWLQCPGDPTGPSPWAGRVLS